MITSTLPLSDRQGKPNGLVLWRGHSQLNGAPIVVIATGLADKSANSKTGDMIQTWVLSEYTHPVAAIHTGADASVCGDCPLRGLIRASGTDTRNRGRACYVQTHQAPRAVWDGYNRGIYPTLQQVDLELFRGRMLRLGSYGDPCAVPYSVWSRLCNASAGRTGYTHQWRQRRFWRFRKLVMASCETIADAELARSRGWRTFRTMPLGELPSLGEFNCPASKEAGQRLTCEQCGACDGAGSNPRRVSVAIQVHGSPTILGSYRKLTI